MPDPRERGYEIALPQEAIRQGRTRHFRDGQLVNDWIATVRFELWGPREAYIFYLDEEGRELNDLMYESLERSIDHVEQEFALTLPREEIIAFFADAADGES